MARRKGLVTFEGWDGKWWRRIKVARAVWDASMWVAPWKVSLAIELGTWAGEELYKRGTVRKHR